MAISEHERITALEEQMANVTAQLSSLSEKISLSKAGGFVADMMMSHAFDAVLLFQDAPTPPIPDNWWSLIDRSKGYWLVALYQVPAQDVCIHKKGTWVNRGPLEYGPCRPYTTCYEVEPIPIGTWGVGAGAQGGGGAGGQGSAQWTTYRYKVWKVVKGKRSVKEMWQKVNYEIRICSDGRWEQVDRQDEPPYWQDLPPEPCLVSREELRTFDSQAEAQAFANSQPSVGPC